MKFRKMLVWRHWSIQKRELRKPAWTERRSSWNRNHTASQSSLHRITSQSAEKTIHCRPRWLGILFPGATLACGLRGARCTRASAQPETHRPTRLAHDSHRTKSREPTLGLPAKPLQVSNNPGRGPGRPASWLLSRQPFTQARGLSSGAGRDSQAQMACPPSLGVLWGLPLPLAKKGTLANGKKYRVHV